MDRSHAANPHVKLGHIYREQKKWLLAEKHYNKAITITNGIPKREEDLAWYYLFLGHALSGRGIESGLDPDYEAAINSYQESNRINCSGDTCLNLWANGVALSGIGAIRYYQHRFAEAVTFFEQSLAAHRKAKKPDQEQIKIVTGNLMAAKGQLN